MRGQKLPSADEIERSADEFRRDYAAGQLGALDIESILEFKLEVDIIPVPGLCAKTRDKGMISHTGRAICIDRHIFAHQAEERRQVLTHETAHLVLHKALLPKIGFGSIDECRYFHANLPTGQLACIEWQAQEWAGRVLMPRRQLEIAFNNAVAEAGEIFVYVDVKKDRLAAWEVFKLYVASLVAGRFGVTDSWAMARIRNDALFDGVRLDQVIADAKKAVNENAGRTAKHAK